jgi:outer membrane protein TolC
VQNLTLVDVTDIALRNNPATRASWEQARAAAYALGAARTSLIPVADASVSAGRTRTTGGTRTTSGSAANGSQNGGVATRTQFEPQLSLSYLLFDFGGRGGAIEEARQNVFATSFAHNATVQNTVLEVQSAYFDYMATKSLLGAQQSQLKEAEANLASANQRHDVGLATIADVLQARTAVSQAQLALETTQGNLQATRGALAAAMGLPANLPYDISARAEDIPIRSVAVSVDSLISAAVRNRPDLQSIQAEARAAQARVGIARSAGLPSVTLGGTAGRTYTSPSNLGGRTYGLSLGVRIPIVSALTNRYNVRVAQADAAATRAQADAVRQLVIQQVFTSYYALQTATQRVTTADDLLASALQSEQVAAGRYREGVGSIIDLLTAQSALADARAQQVQSRWQWSTALAQLAHDAGVLGLRGETPVGLSATPAVRPFPDSSAVTPPDTTHPR